MKDLTLSNIDRQNILNNQDAVENMQDYLGLTGLLYEGRYYFTTKIVADYYDVSSRTLTNVINANEEEIRHNGYQVIKGAKLKEFKDLFGPLLTDIEADSQKETDFPLLIKNDDNQGFKRLKSLAIHRL